jgi:hypothetical protein
MILLEIAGAFSFPTQAEHDEDFSGDRSKCRPSKNIVAFGASASSNNIFEG